MIDYDKLNEHMLEICLLYTSTRVQMPAMVHLTRIGYTYFGKLSEDKNGTVYDGDTNILLLNIINCVMLMKRRNFLLGKRSLFIRALSANIPP